MRSEELDIPCYSGHGKETLDGKWEFVGKPHLPFPLGEVPAQRIKIAMIAGGNPTIKKRDRRERSRRIFTLTNYSKWKDPSTRLRSLRMTHEMLTANS